MRTYPTREQDPQIVRDVMVELEIFGRPYGVGVPVPGAEAPPVAVTVNGVGEKMEIVAYDIGVELVVSRVRIRGHEVQRLVGVTITGGNSFDPQDAPPDVEETPAMQAPEAARWFVLESIRRQMILRRDAMMEKKWGEEEGRVG